MSMSPGLAGAPPPTHAQALSQFAAAPSPDPNTFLQMIWPHLTSHQKELFQALLAQPGTAGTSLGSAASKPITPPGQAAIPSAPPAPAPTGGQPGPAGAGGPPKNGAMSPGAAAALPHTLPGA